MIDQYKFIYALLLFSITNTLVWFQVNSQFISNNLEKHALLINMILSIPIGLGYFYAWKFGMEALEGWWICRFLSFGISFLVFIILNQIFFKEDLFQPKIILSAILAFGIILIQVLWK